MPAWEAEQGLSVEDLVILYRQALAIREAQGPPGLPGFHRKWFAQRFYKAARQLLNTDEQHRPGMLFQPKCRRQVQLLQLWGPGVN